MYTRGKKTELETLRHEKIKGIMIRSRAQWLNEGEKPSKYLSSLEKHLNTEKTVKKIVTDSGNIITNQKDILSEIKKFYASLFKNKDGKLGTYNLSRIPSLKNSTRLTEHEANKLEGSLTVDEISTALKSMKNQKCPGIDGFPADFFKVFWGKLKYFVLRAINSGFTSGELSLSMRQCIISCLPKGDKPRQFLKNWRPISLLSVIYKIASLSLALRLRLVLDKLISNTQSGFMTGRCIAENTRLIYDLINYTNLHKIPGLLVLIDFQSI